MAVNIGVNIQRSPNRINQALRDAGVNGQYPKLLFDFNDDYYLTNGSSKALSDVVTFTRNGNATMVDSDGLIKWAPHNLLTYSEDLSKWTKGSQTLDLNSALAPDGTQTADKLIASTSSAYQQVTYANSFSGLSLTQRVWAKAGGYNYLMMNGPRAGDFTFFNLSDGTIGTTSPDHSNVTITDVGNGWYLCSIDCISDGSGAGFGMSNADNVDQFAGNGTDGIYLWGMHLYRSDLGGMAPLPLSERAFQNDAYYEPDKPAIQAALLRAAVNLEPEKTLFNIEVDGRKLGDVNADGTVSSADALEYTRYVSGDTTYSTYIENVMHPYMVENSATYLAYLDERSSAYYVPTTSSAVYMPRIGHHKYNGDAWVDKGGLFESEARTNLIAYSNDFTQWTSSGSIETGGQAVGRDGNSSLSFIENSSGASTGQTTAIVSVSGSTAYTLSLDLKDAGDNSIQRIGLYDTTSSWHGYIEISWSSGVPSTITNSGASNVNYENCGNGIYRLSFTVTTDATIGSTSFHIHPDRNGVIGAGVYAGFVSLEAASTPSSYIPTNGSSVTRAAESITVPYANLPWPTPTYIGDELVTNGTFDTDVSGWSATGSAPPILTWNPAGYAEWDRNGGTSGVLGQTISSLVAGSVYEVSFDVVSVWPSVQVTLDGVSVFGSNISSTGSYTGYVVAVGGSKFLGFSLIGSADATGAIDNVSVREINPLSVSIAMQGEINYSGSGSDSFFQWRLDSNTYINDVFFSDYSFISAQKDGSIYDQVATAPNYFTGDLNEPFDIASRHGSTFINAAVDGTARTANTTPVLLPALSSSDLLLAYDYMGTISEFRIWDRDIGDTGIAQATKPSTEPSLSLTFDGQPSSFTNTGLTL